MSFAMTRTPAAGGGIRARTGAAALAAAPAACPAATAAAAAETPLAGARGDGSAASASEAAAGDALLVARAARGDVAAFGSLVERYQRPMAALVARMTANPDDVDDVVQELFIRAWKGLPRFRGDAQFSTWLYRIAVNTAIKHRSRRKNDAAVSLSAEERAGGLDALRAAPDAGPLSGGDPYEAAVARERETQIRRAVHALPEKQRVVIALHYFEGRSCEEIAEILDCSVGTIWSRLHYACKRLRGLLEAGD